VALEQDDWKQKYKELAQECEALQRDTDSTASRARALSSQLALGLRGQSAALDAELDLLLQMMRKPDINGQFDRVLGRVERQIKLLDDQRLSVSKDIRVGFERWINQLRSINQSEPFTNLLNASERRVPEAAEHFYKLAELLQELVELQKGLLPAQAENEHSFALSASDPNDVVDLEMLESRIATEMLNLIEALNIEASGLALARELIARIEKGIPAADLPDVMASLVKLARLSTGLEHQEFETYLLSLNEQLTYVQDFLSQSRQEESRAFEAHQQLDHKVRRDVSKLHQSVKSSNDLLSLKKAVAEQLTSIVRTMDRYKDHESEREGRMQQRYDALVERVEQMEVEAGRVRSRMEEERVKARTDPLTGLPNRAAYDDQLATELERWQRYNTPFSVAVVDLDRFKRINDDYGHLAGDKVLRLVARVLQRNLRGSDFIARYGGEEFVLIFPSTGKRDSLVAADKLREAVKASPFNFKGEPVMVTASFGVAEVQPDDDAETLFGRADCALYRAKEGGRDRVIGSE
jgi:diguanylate cyclase